MQKLLVLGVVSAFAVGLLGGCGDDDDDNGGGKGGTAGSAGASGGGGASGSGGATGGASGSGGATGGASGSGGATGGSAGMDGGAGEAGEGGTAGEGGAAGADSGTGFWQSAYDPNCAPAQASHNAGQNCLGCHTGTMPTDGGFVPQWHFGGTVYAADGTTGVAGVEVGVDDGTSFFYACTDSAGNFYYPAAGAGAPNWTTAETRIRDASGEKAMNQAPASGACNQCHTGGLVLKEP
jgi:hypothetical protein